VKKAQVDKTKCIGCGTCTVIAPKAFKLEDDGKAVFVEGTDEAEEKIGEAIESCPVQALQVIE
jgi:ferredoxin